MNKTEVKNKWNTPATVFGWLVLIAFTALSAHMNAEYARIVNEPVSFHAGIPAAVLLLGVIVEFTFMSDAHRAAKIFILSGLGGCFVWVMMMSYQAVSLVVGSWNAHAPGWMNAGAAAIPDVVMVMAATLIMSLRMRSHRAVKATAASPTRSALSQIRGNYMQRMVTRSEGKKPQVQPLVEVREAFTEPSPNTVTEVPVPSGEPAATATSSSVEPFVDAPVEVAKPSPKSSSKSSSKATKPSPIVLVDESLAPFMDAAQDMVSRRVVARKTMVELAQVIREIEAGKSNNAIKSLLGVSPSTTEAVRFAWDDWMDVDDTTHDEEQEFALA